MEQYKDYYKIMGLTPEASEKDIKMAYRRLARKYHPDISKEANAEDKFKELGEAYEVLKDSEKRATYDQYVQGIKMHGNGAKPSQSQQWSTGGESFQFDDDFFASIFGSPYRAQNVPGADFQTELSITLEEAYHGTERSLKLATPEGEQTLRVKIPAGIKSGQKIRLAGQGGPGRAGGKKGDLYVTVHISKHALFDVKGKDVYVTLPVTPWEVALGEKIMVPTLGGQVGLQIPPNSQGGQKLRLKNRGMPGQPGGDQYVILKIVTPKATTESAKAFYRKMQEEMPFNPREQFENAKVS